MKNAEWMLKNGMKFSRLSWGYSRGRNIVYYETNNTKPLAIWKELYSEPSTVSKNLITKWLDMEHKERVYVLNNAERTYLSVIIKPFRDRVNCICKVNFVNFNNHEGCVYQHIVIGIDDSPEVVLPLFKAGTMYKGMETGHMYMPEELGL